MVSSVFGADQKVGDMIRSDIIGGFQRLKEIGAGAQAKVWKAKCVEDVHGIVSRGAIVALKIKNVQSSDSDEQFERLKRRVDELKAMKDPNVVRYLGCFRDRSAELDRHVIVQEYLEGETLKERLSKLRLGLDVDEGLRIVREAASGLSYTSGLKIFHRDIKPGNIFLCEDGSVKLIDFGVAKQDGETVDGASNFRGTFDYMAPDFMSSTFSGDHQSDIFSLGVVLHEIISGKLPYIDGAGSDWQGWMSRWRQWTADSDKADSPIFVHAMTLRLLNGANEVLEKALEPNRAKRYQSFEEFSKDLDKITFYEQKHEGRTYRRLQFVGKGGFGEVFKARWLEENVDVAIKQLLNAEYAKRFLTEAKVMQELQDPCFVKFIDFFETSDHAFLVMKFLDGMPGSSLRDAINRAGKNGIPKNLVLPAFERYARGLSLMHKRKIIHRDIKPSNLYYPAGRPDLVAIMDFGIVKAEDSSFTSGMVPCTFDYAPPEIAVTEDRGGPGMDIYALGLCMYEALTGRQGYPRIPTGTAGMMTFFERCKSKKKPNFDDSRVVGDVQLLALLKKMTAPELSERYRNADEVAIEIRKLFYRKTEDDDCPPTQVFNPETDQTLPIDEKRLMAWYREWVKVHPEALEEPVVPDPVRPRRWKKMLLTGLVSACVSIGGVFLVQKVMQTNFRDPIPDIPDKQDSTVIDLKRQLFEKDFATALSDEPVESRRKRVANGKDMLALARNDGLFEGDEKWSAFEKALEDASTAVVGKIKNNCGCDLVIDGSELAVGEVRLFKFEDGKCANRRMKIFGYDERTVPQDLDGKTIEVKKSDFVVSSVKVSLPRLESGVSCYFGDQQVSADLSLKPGDYMCEYRRKGYESQKFPFTVKLGQNGTLPTPKTWEMSFVDVSLPKLENGILAQVDGKEVQGAFKLRPGEYKVEYTRTGYDKQVRDFVVQLATPRTLPAPENWRLSRVKVTVSELPTDVICRIDGLECSSCVELFPGKHGCEYSRRGYATVTNSFDVALATPMTLIAPKQHEWRALPVTVKLPKLSADISLFVNGEKPSKEKDSLSLLPGDYKIKFRRPNYQDQDSDLTVEPGKDTAIGLPDSQKWLSVKKPPELQPKLLDQTNAISPEIRNLLSEARFYFDDGDFELTVKKFHDAFVKGYRLNANDMNVFETAYKKRRDYLKGRIEDLEKQEYRKKQNLRDVEEHREKLRQLGNWYRTVKQL